MDLTNSSVQQNVTDSPEDKEINLVEELKKWLQCNPGITAVKVDDTLKLLYFIRCTKHDIERSKKKVERLVK